MKNPFLLAGSTLVLGIAIGWFAKPAPQPEENSRTEAVPRPAAQSGETAPAPEKSLVRERREERVKPKEEKDDPLAEFPPEQRKRMEDAQNQMAKRMLDAKQAKIEKHIAKLSEALSLTDAQKADLQGWLDGKMKEMGDLNLMNPAEKKDSHALVSALTEAGLEKELQANLTDEQKTALKGTSGNLLLKILS